MAGSKEKIEAIFFDVGNTLVDIDMLTVATILGDTISLSSSDVIFLEKKLWLSLNGYLEACDRNKIESDTLSFIVKYFLKFKGKKNKEKYIKLVAQEHRRSSLWRVVNLESIPVLEKLVGLKIRLGIISNSDGRVASLLKNNDLLKYFDLVVDSNNVGIKKPHKEIFYHAVKKMKVIPSQSLYVGDLPYLDVIGPINAGLTPILYDRYNVFKKEVLKISKQSSRKIYRITKLKQLIGFLEDFTPDKD